MIRRLLRWLAAAPLVLACGLELPPPTPPKPIAGATCADACATLERLGGCKAMPATQSCEAACKRLNDGEDIHGEPIIGFPTGCVAAATSCAEFEACK